MHKIEQAMCNAIVDCINTLESHFTWKLHNTRVDKTSIDTIEVCLYNNRIATLFISGNNLVWVVLWDHKTLKQFPTRTTVSRCNAIAERFEPYTRFAIRKGKIVFV